MTRNSDRTFEEHSGAVYAWAYRLLGRHHDALDVVQEVFLKWIDQCRVSPPSSARGWLRRTTLNQAVDLIRRRRAHERAVEARTVRDRAGAERGESPGDDGAPTFDSVPGATGAESREEATRRQLAGAMAELPERQLAVLVAKVFDGLTFAQVACELSLSVSTAKTHYVRALRFMRERLNPQGS